MLIIGKKISIVVVLCTYIMNYEYIKILIINFLMLSEIIYFVPS